MGTWVWFQVSASLREYDIAQVKAKRYSTRRKSIKAGWGVPRATGNGKQGGGSLVVAAAATPALSKGRSTGERDPLLSPQQGLA